MYAGNIYINDVIVFIFQRDKTALAIKLVNAKSDCP